MSDSINDDILKLVKDTGSNYVNGLASEAQMLLGPISRTNGAVSDITHGQGQAALNDLKNNPQLTFHDIKEFGQGWSKGVSDIYHDSVSIVKDIFK